MVPREEPATATGLDHLGLVSADGPALWAAWEALGFRLTPLSRQSGASGPLGTGNRCAMLRGGGYVELLARLDPDLPDNGLSRLLEGPGAARILALAASETAGNLARLRRAGLDLPGVSPLSRPVEGGTARFERLPLPEAPEGRVQLVRHLTPGLLWRDPWLDHPNGARRLAEAILVAGRPAESAARLSRLAGLPFEPDPAGGYALPFPDGTRARVLPPGSAADLLPGLDLHPGPGVAAPGVAAMVIEADGPAPPGPRPTPLGPAYEAGGCVLVLRPPGGAAP